MAHYEHLSIYREAMRLAVHLENVVRGFARYHKFRRSRYASPTRRYYVSITA